MATNEVLLVIDVQRLYMEPDPMKTSDGNDLVPKCRSLIESARSAGVPVIYVQHLSDDQPDDPALVAIHPDISPVEGEPVVQKRFGSAFFRTELGDVLAERNAKTLYICGLATFGCVNATVMCAVCKDYNVRVVQDAHGSPDFPDTPAETMVDIFNKTWERAGATLIQAADVWF